MQLLGEVARLPYPCMRCCMLLLLVCVMCGMQGALGAVHGFSR